MDRELALFFGHLEPASPAESNWYTRNPSDSQMAIVHATTVGSAEREAA